MNELEKEVKKMIEKGEVERLKNGELAIAVSLATKVSLPQVSRQARKDFLHKQFQKTLGDLIGKDLEVDFTSISTSGQTVDAKVAIENLSSLFSKLQQKSLAIYPIRNRQVI